MLFSRQDLASTKAEAPPKDETLSALGLWLRYIVHAWAAMMYAFTRRSFGRGFFNFWGMSGLLVLSFWAVVTTPPQDALAISVMMAAFVMLSLWHRHRSPKELNGEVLHSRYMGWPLICDVLPIREDVAKCVVEPGVVCMIGVGMVQINESLGWFIVIGGIACMLDWLYLSRRDYSRARQIHDAEKEQERMIETYDRYFDQRSL